MPCRMDCIQVGLETVFYKYGKFVYRHPIPFIIIPVVVSLGLLVGMVNFEDTADTEYLYTPTNGPAKVERTLMKNLFPENDSYYFSASRKSNRDGFFQIIVTEPSGGNIYTEEHLANVITLNTNVTSLMADSLTSYQDICAKWQGTCVDNEFLVILNGSASSIRATNITYPLYNTMSFLGYQLGGVVVDGNDHIQSAEAILLTYYLSYQTKDEVELAKTWLEVARVYTSTYTLDGLTINYASALSLSEELEKSVSGIIPKFAIAFTVLMTFCVMASIMIDWVRAKVWVAFAGELAAGMAIVTSLGLLSACGVLFTSVVATMPFLLIGIGIDDMFVMLSSWRHTDYRLPAEERMGLMMKTAAVSVTLTSVTDAMAFLIGAITTFRSVTLFCAYTGVAVVFSYIYAMTFLAAFFALSGKREEANMHEMTCKKILPTTKAANRSRPYQICCTGGYIAEEGDDMIKDAEKKNNIADNKEMDEEPMLALPLMTEVLRDYVGPFVMLIPVKIIIMIIYCMYLAIAIWGCTTLKEGLQLKNLAPDGSYLIGFFNNEDKYFRVDYGPRVMMAFTQTLDYSDATVRRNIFDDLSVFRNNSVFYSEDIYFESWLSSYLTYLSDTSQSVPTDMTSFINILTTQFLLIPGYDRYVNDIQFNSDITNITASRFLIQGKGVPNTLAERKLMLESRDIAESSTYDIEVYQFGFIYFDQYTVIVPNTLQNIGIAVACMLLVSLLLLPNLISVLCVTLSVVSIIGGVIGYMAFWGVSLDSISMINLIMCIGFSVDFSAHISYHFSISKGKTGRDRAIESFGHLGTPVVNGAISTILGTVVLSTSGTYIFRTFFKIMFLVILFGFFHAMFVLPVVLSVIGPQTCCNSNNEDEKINKRNGHVNPSFTEDKKQNGMKENAVSNEGVTIVSGNTGPPYISTLDIHN